MQEAIGSSKDTRPAILFIEEDEDTHPTLKNNLRSQGYRVLLAVCLEDAIDWLDGGYVHADLVLLDLIGKSTDDTLTAGRHIRQYAKYNGHTPLVVMAEKYGKDLEGTDVNVSGNDWIFYLGEDSNQLYNLIGQLLQPYNQLEKAS
jgi:CheY-like chemotaxis protein